MADAIVSQFPKARGNRPALDARRAAGLKLCNVCREEKPLEAFSKDKSRSDGFQPRCKACYSLYRQANPKSRPKLTVDEKYPGGRQACTSCGIDKPLSEFKKFEIPKNTYRTSCNDCYAKHRAEWLAKDSARKVAWAKANPEWCKAYFENWRLKNRPPKKRRQIFDTPWKVRNRARSNELARMRYAKNREKESERYKRYVERNRDTMRAIWRNRHARKKNAIGSHTRDDIKRLHELQRGCCAACFKPLKGKYHVDHRIALANGGANDWTNLQLLHPRCNIQKSARDPIEYMQVEHGLLL